MEENNQNGKFFCSKVFSRENLIRDRHEISGPYGGQILIQWRYEPIGGVEKKEVVDENVFGEKLGTASLTGNCPFFLFSSRSGISCSFSYPLVSVLKFTNLVIGARGLKPRAGGAARNPYCVVKYGKNKFTSDPVQGTLDPTWNHSAILYELLPRKFVLTFL